MIGKRCHRAKQFGSATHVECMGERCALWDCVQECCGDMSEVMDKRRSALVIVSDLVDNFEGSLRQVEQEMEKGGLDVETFHFKRGERNVLGQVIRVLRGRFGIR